MFNIFILLLLFYPGLTEFCGSDKIVYGVEVHKNGALTLLCSRPNCIEKRFFDCPERSEEISCNYHRNKVLSGTEKTVDGKIFIKCCEFENFMDHAKLRYRNVFVRRGEYFEGEEKTNRDGDVLSFDIVTNMQQIDSNRGAFYNLTVHRFDCSSLDYGVPSWKRHRPWPFYVLV